MRVGKTKKCNNKISRSDEHIYNGGKRVEEGAKAKVGDHVYSCVVNK